MRIVDYIYMTMVLAFVVLILLLFMAAMASSDTCVTFHDVDPSHLDHKRSNHGIV